ncbi:MAG: oxidoreductase [Devosia sp.]|nr:oxidoreductase [Devosia sp.]
MSDLARTVPAVMQTDLPKGFSPAVITQIEVVAVGTKRFVLTLADGAAPPDLEPGAHIDVLLPSGKIRQYSTLCDDVEGAVTIVVKREARGRGGSAELHELSVGDVVGLGEARNHFALEPGSGPVVLIAGGIGITPILSMARHLAASSRPWTIHYAARRREDMAFREELAPRPEARLHFDMEAGHVLDMAEIVASLPEDAHLYCCGPLPMLNGYRAATKDLPQARVHYELFESTQEAATTGGFDVECARSGLVLRVQEGRRIIDVLLDAGINVPMSCEKGICGSCEIPVLEGIPDHRDDVLSDEEKASNEMMMVCCGGCKGDRLVLDI